MLKTKKSSLCGHCILVYKFARVFLVLTLVPLTLATVGVLRSNWQCQEGNGDLQDSGRRGGGWLGLSHPHSYGS